MSSNVTLLISEPSSKSPPQGEAAIAEAVARLRRGEVVAFPTETVYGLGAKLSDSQALDRLFSVKGRPATNPIAIQIGDLKEVNSLAEELPKAFFLLAEAFLPGPLTIVVKKQPHIPDRLTGGRKTIGIRFSAHPIALELVQRLGEPIALSSANLSGQPSLSTGPEVFRSFLGDIAVVDGGPATLGTASTVVSLEDPIKPLLIRAGTLSYETLALVLPTLQQGF